MQFSHQLYFKMIWNWSFDNPKVKLNLKQQGVDRTICCLLPFPPSPFPPKLCRAAL